MERGGPKIVITPPDTLEVELEMDQEWMKVRAMRQEQYERAGIGDFPSFRLALDPDVNWHKVVAAKKAGASDDQLIDWFLE